MNLMEITGLSELEIEEILNSKMICIQEQNEMLKGLYRDVFNTCGYGVTRTDKLKQMVKCPECGSRNIKTSAGDESLKKRNYPSGNLGQQMFDFDKMNVSLDLKQMKGGQNKKMVSKEQKVAELREQLRELIEKFEEAGVEVSYTDVRKVGNPNTIVTKETINADETKGIVSNSVPENELSDNGMVLELAESGRGFALWREYEKDKSGKLKRLVRE